MSPFVSGETIAGRYQVDREIGRGAFGVVYAATQLGLRRRVAMKVLSAPPFSNPRLVTRFEREAEALSRLSHPQIVQVFDFGLHAGTPFLILEWVAGETLVERIRREGPMAPRRAAALCAQIARALAHAHGLGIIHRDLKPANVMSFDPGDGAGERVKVLDFGLAKVLDLEDAGGRLTAPGQLLGTAHFASPEQILGQPADARSDLYSLGCLLYACLTTSAPYASEGRDQVTRRRLTEPPPPLPAHREREREAWPALDRLYAALLERSPGQRPASAELVAQALDAIVETPIAAVDDRGSTAPVPVPDDRLRPSVAAAVVPPAPASTDPQGSLTATVLSATALIDRPAALSLAQGSVGGSSGDDLTPIVARAAEPAEEPHTVATERVQPAPRARSAATLILLAAAPVLALGLWWTLREPAPAPPPPRVDPQVVAEGAQPRAAPVASPVPVPKLRLDSEPRDAEVWRDGVLLGRTPLEIEAGGEQQLTLKKSGYRDRLLSLGPGDPQRIELEKVTPVRRRPPSKNDPAYPVW